MKRFALDRRTSLTASFVCVALAGLFGLSFNSDRVIENGFKTVMTPSNPTIATVNIPGTEDFWLKQAELDAKAHGQELEHVVWSKPLGIGDTFTVGSGADRKELKVIAVKEREPAVTRLEIGTVTGKQLWIQARDAALGTTHTVRLDVDPALPL